MSTLEKPESKTNFSTVILGAGIGKRMHSNIPKIMHRILGKTMISFIVDKVITIGCYDIVIVVGDALEMVKKELGNKFKYVVQQVPLGTGDAAKKGIVRAANPYVLILNGDIPLLSSNTLKQLLLYFHKADADLAILTCCVENPYGYGRIIRDEKNIVIDIIEHADATPQEQKIKEINVGVYYGRKNEIFQALENIKSDNQQGELYITDVIRKFIEQNKKVVGFRTQDTEEIIGINTPEELEQACQIAKTRRFEELSIQTKLKK